MPSLRRPRCRIHSDCRWRYASRVDSAAVIVVIAAATAATAVQTRSHTNESTFLVEAPDAVPMGVYTPGSSSPRDEYGKRPNCNPIARAHLVSYVWISRCGRRLSHGRPRRRQCFVVPPEPT